ncbi:MFS transporter [Breoghania sp.]|uniref:MFS transporter n=1 Tax=Breoghania sp. TaxID=2065378 RepID=UPI002AA6EEE5|nr:MFS transporter [Breoghania sp.]
MANTPSTAQTRKLFYGWIIVFAVFLLAGTAAGLIYAFSVFFDAISREFDATRAQVSLIFSGAEFIWFLSGFLGGFLADRLGPTRVVLFGAVLMAGGLFCASQSQTITGIVLSYAVGVGVGGGFIYIPSISLVPCWFKRQRGFATGIALCGVGLGTFSLPLLGEALLVPLGWDGSHVVFAIIALVVCGGLSFFLIPRPQAIGLTPDGDPHSPLQMSEQTVPGLSLSEALRHRAFWHFYFASLLTAAVIFTTYVHLVPFAIDNGNDSSSSVGLIGTVGIASIAGRFIFGGLSDRIGSRRTISLMSAGMALAVAWWLFLVPTLGNLYVYALIFGAFYGGYISTLPVLAMAFFGGRQLSTIIGALYTSWGAGALIGPTMTGVLFDFTGTYTTGLLASIGFLLVASLICLFIRDRAVPY